MTMKKNRILIIFIFYLIEHFLVSASQEKKPNIILFLTDDQDNEMDSLTSMPKLLSLVQAEGLTFTNSFVVTPLCCPSRSSILTGQYVHNHGTINNSLAGGCNSDHWQKGPEKEAFPVLLKNAGYTTFFAGKYLNQYGNDKSGGLSHIPPGWSSWVGLKGNSVYYNYYLSVNGTPTYHGENPDKDYLTNIIRDEGLKFIQEIPTDNPFFMMLSTPACHDPITPEPKYEHSLNESRIPETANFNIENGKDKHWLLRFGEQPLREELTEKVEEMYRNRLRTLMSVDDMVEAVIQALEKRDFLRSTYIFFTSDHGYHLGQFSMPKDKRQPYEFDIRVPLMVKGPWINKGITIKDASINIDLAPTFLDLAEIPIPDRMDGISLKNLILGKYSSATPNVPNERFFLIDHSGEGIDGVHAGCEHLGTGLGQCLPDLDCKCQDAQNNTYSCIRRIGSAIDDIFCKFNDDEHFEEYYDIKNDPDELYNNVRNLSSNQYSTLTGLLNALMDCSGKTCLELS